MTPGAIRGAKLFIGHAGCAECHSGPMFTDFAFHNIGAPQQGEYVPATDNGRLDGIDALKSDPFNRGGDVQRRRGQRAPRRAQADDRPHRRAAAALAGQFKTPSLRNVSKTAPYMHDGAYQSLWDVVNHYNFGGETGSYAGEKGPGDLAACCSATTISTIWSSSSRRSTDGDPLATADFPEGLTAPPALPP